MQSKTSSSPTRRTSSSSFGSKSRSPISRTSSSPKSSFGSRPRTTSFGSSTRPSFSGGRSGGGGRRGPKSERIDENKYINKAVNKEDSVYNPKHTFKDFNIHATLAKNIIAKGFTHPSPIQDQAIPVALTGRDIIGIASTGTGKTAAFLIPIINKLVSDKNYRAIVLAPTRELAQQTQEEFFNL